MGGRCTVVIGADIAAALPRLRAQALSLMLDRARVKRPGGEERDPDNGQMVTRWRLVSESVPVRVIRVGVGDSVVVAGGQTVEVASVEFRAPWDFADLRIGDRVTVTTFGDPRLTNVPVTVTEVGHESLAVARRFRGVLDEDRHV